MNEELLKHLDQLADKLGTTAVHLWTVLVHQARIEAIEDITFVLFTFVCSAIVVKVWIKYGERWMDDDKVALVSITVGASLVCFVLAIMAVILIFSDIPTELFNPEYWALKQIIK